MRRLALSAALLLAAALPAAAQDAPPGQRVFRAQCGACHSVDAGKNGVGPSLHGIVGRAAGAVDGFRYSNGMKTKAAEGFKWTAENLRAYVENPRAVVPGGNMPYAGLRNEEQRNQLVEYLATLR
jgi:cytochrome c